MRQCSLTYTGRTRCGGTAHTPPCSSGSGSAHPKKFRSSLSSSWHRHLVSCRSDMQGVHVDPVGSLNFPAAVAGSFTAGATYACVKHLDLIGIRRPHVGLGGHTCVCVAKLRWVRHSGLPGLPMSLVNVSGDNAVLLCRCWQPSAAAAAANAGPERGQSGGRRV